MDAVVAWIALAGAPGMSRALARALVERFGAPGTALAAGEARLRAHCAPAVAAALADRRACLDAAHRVLERAHVLGARALVPGSPEFPALLAAIPDPPLVLWARGVMPSGPVLAVVGARRG